MRIATLIHSQPLPSPATAGATAGRVDWLDAARGLGILLVVFAHCLRGLEASGIVAATPAVLILDRVIYAFHMPLFFVLSGLTLRRVLTRQPMELFWNRCLRLLWPLTLWTWIFFSFRALAQGASNSHTGWADVPWIPLPPQAHFWFLWALFVMTMVLAPLRRLWLRHGGEDGFWLTASALSLVLALTVPVPAALGSWLVPAVIYAPCLLLGVLLERRLIPLPRPATTGAALVVFALSLLLATLAEGRLVDLVVALVAPLGLLIALRGLIPTGTPGGVLALLGRATMPIFLAHTIFSAALRIGLVQLGLTDPTLHLVAGTLVGLVGPLLMWRLALRLGISRWIGF